MSELAVRNISKVFVDRRRQVEAIKHVSLDFAENEFTTIVGTTGCGKSTLLLIAAGLEEQTTGEVFVDGEPITGPGRDRGMVFQSYTLFPWLTAQKNIEFALRDESMSKQERRDVAREHLELVGLDAFADAYPMQLSGGMRQRVAIARALCYRPTILLMDEPFGALDAQTRQVMQELLTRVWEQHRLTVLFVTHDIDEAVFLSDRVIVMTARPGEVKLDIRIELERPRRFEMLAEPEFAHYKGELLASVRGESMKMLKAQGSTLPELEQRDQPPADDGGSHASTLGSS
jgi:NitT/TauT family transport system ATP-binding protein